MPCNTMLRVRSQVKNSLSYSFQFMLEIFKFVKITFIWYDPSTSFYSVLNDSCGTYNVYRPERPNNNSHMPPSKTLMYTTHSLKSSLLSKKKNIYIYKCIYPLNDSLWGVQRGADLFFLLEGQVAQKCHYPFIKKCYQNVKSRKI